jgi:hypothetical protein
MLATVATFLRFLGTRKLVMKRSRLFPPRSLQHYRATIEPLLDRFA